MKLIHEGIVFDNEEIEFAKNNLSKTPQKTSYRQIKIMANKYLSYKTKPIAGKLYIPKFYTDRAGWRKAVYNLEKSANVMIVCANMYKITEDQKYAKKVIEIANAWTNYISGYKKEQALYEANWNLQIMSTACELIRNDYEENIIDFLKWDYKQCLKLMKLNKKENNLKYWLAAHMITVAITNEDKELFDKACNIYKKAIRFDITKNGDMPKETVRGYRGIHYTFFAIDSLIFIAEAAKHQGKDLFSYNYKNKSILTAIEYIMPFIENPKKWPWSKEKQDFSIFPYIHSGWCEIVYREWKLKEIEDFLNKYRPLFDSRNGGAQTLFHGKQISKST